METSKCMALTLRREDWTKGINVKYYHHTGDHWSHECRWIHLGKEHRGTRERGLGKFKDQRAEGNPATLFRRSNWRRRKKTKRMFHKHGVRRGAGVHSIEHCWGAEHTEDRNVASGSSNMEAFVKFNEKHLDGMTGAEVRMKWAERQGSPSGEEEVNSLGKFYSAEKGETWSGGGSRLRENSRMGGLELHYILKRSIHRKKGVDYLL